jgi:DJ-1/PfpI family
LDILLIPGGDPHHIQTLTERKFILDHVNNPNVTAVMSICTGANILTRTGALTGKEATAPFVLLRLLKTTNPEVNWSMKRWTSDASKRIWSSGSVANGLDMVAAWAKDYFWDREELVKFALLSVAVGDRGSEYSKEEKEYWNSLDLREHDMAHLNGDLKPGIGDGMAGMDHGSMMNQASFPAGPSSGERGGVDHAEMAEMFHGSRGGNSMPGMSHGRRRV